MIRCSHCFLSNEKLTYGKGSASGIYHCCNLRITSWNSSPFSVFVCVIRAIRERKYRVSRRSRGNRRQSRRTYGTVYLQRIRLRDPRDLRERKTRLSQKPRQTQTKPQNVWNGVPFRVFVCVIRAIRERKYRVSRRSLGKRRQSLRTYGTVYLQRIRLRDPRDPREKIRRISQKPRQPQTKPQNVWNSLPSAYSSA